MIDTALVLLVMAGLLLVVGLSQPLAVRIGLPPSVVADVLHRAWPGAALLHRALLGAGI